MDYHTFKGGIDDKPPPDQPTNEPQEEKPPDKWRGRFIIGAVVVIVVAFGLTPTPKDLFVFLFIFLFLLGGWSLLWYAFRTRDTSTPQSDEPRPQQQTPTYQPPPPPDHRIFVENKDRERALWVIGLPGSGKSWALESWIFQDAIAGRGCGFLDPAADSFNRLVTRFASEVAKHPELAERLVIIDPTNKKWTVGFNPLEKSADMSEELQANFFTDILIKIWGINPNESPRMMMTLNFAFLALLNLNLTLMDMPRFLVDTDYRENQLRRCTNEEAKLFFEKQYPTNQGAIQQWAGPVLNKIHRFVINPDIRLMLTTKTAINFRKIMDEEKILLVNLSKGELGEDASTMLGGFIVANIQKAALARASSTHRPRFYLYLDEFQNYTTDNIKDILAESRKYGLSLILAHQQIDQLKGDLRNAVTNITGTIASFLVSESDAPFLARAIFPEDALSKHKYNWDGALPSREKQSPKDRELQELLTSLKKTEFWMRQRGDNPPYKMRAFNFPEPAMTPTLKAYREQLIEIVMQRYGRLKSEAKQQAKDDRPRDDYTDYDKPK